MYWSMLCCGLENTNCVILMWNIVLHCLMNGSTIMGILLYKFIILWLLCFVKQARCYKPHATSHLTGQKPIVYCVDKPIVVLKSNRPQYLSVYRCNNPCRMLGECLRLMICKLFLCSPNIPCGLLWLNKAITL